MTFQNYVYINMTFNQQEVRVMFSRFHKTSIGVKSSVEIQSQFLFQ